MQDPITANIKDNDLKNTIIILTAFLFIQCSKDEPTSLNQTNCIGNSELPFGGLSNCNDESSMMYLCEVYSVGNYTLEPSSKAYMPLFCKDTGSEIIFQNNAGGEIIVTLGQKQNRKGEATYNTFKHCPSDSIRSIGYCIASDRVSYSLRSKSTGLDLMIILSTIPDIYQTKVGYIGDVLAIHRKQDPSSYLVEFNAVVNQRSLSYAKSRDQEFYTTINLEGTNYQNVISNDVSKYSTPLYKYYYNNDIGLLAFRDTNGIVWKLKK